VFLGDYTLLQKKMADAINASLSDFNDQYEAWFGKFNRCVLIEKNGAKNALAACKSRYPFKPTLRFDVPLR
jgi:hypothetical protein